MTLINNTYFLRRKTTVPNQKSPAVLDNLDSYIAVYEKEYREKVFGIVLNDEFEAGLGEVIVDPKWLALRDGATFEYEDVTYRWKGFNNALKDSTIALYVFWVLVRDGNTEFTGVGTISSVSENADRVSPIHLLVLVWNRMACDNAILEKFLLANEADYPNYKPQDTLTETMNIYGI
jgi:hypothetical protein